MYIVHRTLKERVGTKVLGDVDLIPNSPSSVEGSKKQFARQSLFLYPFNSLTAESVF